MSRGYDEASEKCPPRPDRPPPGQGPILLLAFLAAALVGACLGSLYKYGRLPW
jgi:hypothetical protein